MHRRVVCRVKVVEKFVRYDDVVSCIINVVVVVVVRDVVENGLGRGVAPDLVHL